jgi:hypothetical protein
MLFSAWSRSDFGSEYFIARKLSYGNIRKTTQRIISSMSFRQTQTIYVCLLLFWLSIPFCHLQSPFFLWIRAYFFSFC